MKKLYFSLILGSFLGLAIFSPFLSASAVISSAVDIQRYGARNISKSESVYSQNVTAIEGDELEFSVNIKNTSSNQANRTVLYVYLPVGFPLDSNSISVNGVRTGGNISNGLFLGNIEPNFQKDIVFRTRVNSQFNGYAGIQTQVVGENFSSDNKYVSVTKNGSDNNATVSQTISATGPTYTTTTNTATPSNLLGVSVLGKNLTKQDVNWQKTVKAEPGDLIQFSIMLTANTGITIKNVYVKDTLDNFLDFVSGSVKLNDAPASDNLISGQLLAGDITASAVKFVKFQSHVRSASQFGKETIVLSNTVQAWAENNTLITDTSSVSVAVKQAEEKKPTTAVSTVKKTTGSIVTAATVTPKTQLVVPKEKPKATHANSFLIGTIGFDSFCLLIILILLALVVFLLIALRREKKKNKESASNQHN